MAIFNRLFRTVYSVNIVFYYDEMKGGNYMCNTKYEIIEIIERHSLREIQYQEAMHETLEDIATEICQKLKICECCGQKLKEEV